MPEPSDATVAVLTAKVDALQRTLDEVKRNQEAHQQHHVLLASDNSRQQVEMATLKATLQNRSIWGGFGILGTLAAAVAGLADGRHTQ